MERSLSPPGLKVYLKKKNYGVVGGVVLFWVFWIKKKRKKKNSGVVGGFVLGF